MENLGDIDVQTIAGAISTATHGTGARLRNISSQVGELTLVLADGSTLACSAERDPDVLRAARVGLGALGVDRRGDAALRAGVHAARRRRARAAGRRRSSASRSSRSATTTSSSSSSRTADDGADAHEQPHRRAAAARAAALQRLRQRRPAHQPRLRAALPRRAPAARRGSRSSTGSSRGWRAAPSGSTARRRSSPAPRLVRFTEMEYALPRERTPRGGPPRDGADRASAASRCRSRSR